MLAHRVGAAGAALVVDDDGVDGADTTLVLHGFTGSAAAMAPVSERLAAGGLRVLAPDLVGHGRSEAPSDLAAYSMEAAVEQLIAVLDHLGLDRVDIVGYSMGGRLALTLAVSRPDRVRSLVAISASPGLADAFSRRDRIAKDHALADSIEADGVEAFVERWIENPLFAPQKRLPAAVQDRSREQRLVHRAHGLANSLRGMGTGAMAPLHEQLSTLDVPVHWVAGALDTKFVAIAEAIDRRPNWQRSIIDDRGHALYLEAPETVAQLTVDFQRALGPDR